MTTTETGDLPAILSGAHAPAPPPQRTLAVQFTGSGSEYFRIWIVNLLLTLVTLTLYHPFAKARRLRWLHANTLVGGQALGFHGNPWKMLRGYLLVLAFSASYALANRFSPMAGLVALGMLAVLWPALWQASLRFRLANTSWRGLRMRFSGSLGDAYRALAPLLLPLALFALGTALAPEAPAGAATGRGAAPPNDQGNGLTVLVLALAPLLGMSMLPWLTARSKRYQHGHYQWAGQTTQLTVPTRAFYGVWMRLGLMTLLPMFLLGLLAALVLPRMQQRGQGAGGLVVVGVLAALVYIAVTLLGRAYMVARLQDLVWDGTRSPQLQFHSDLHAGDLAWLLLKNLLLTALTLGLYWPFAVAHTARLRLQAVRLTVNGDIDAWVGSAAAEGGDAAGDAAGDLLDIDIGL